MTLTADTPDLQSKDGRASSLTVGGIELDRQNMRVLRAGRELRLSPIEFRLLELFMCNPGRAFTRKQLIRLVWRSHDLELRTVDVTIGRLRKALNRGWMPDPIHSVRFRGYMFNDNFDQISRDWEANGRKKLRLGQLPRRPVALA
jgi:two-component system phosphate regulon response regulator PhoB